MDTVSAGKASGTNSWTYPLSTTRYPTGTHTITATATDSRGRKTTKSTSVTFTNADTVAPTAPGNLSASYTSSQGVTLTWSASTDNMGVSGYRIYRAGALLAAVAATTYMNSAVAPGANYSYQVSALDFAGNESSFSAPISIMIPSPSFVTRSGTKLMLDGSEFRFQGLNIYDAYKINLDSALSQIGPGQVVFRAFFYQHMATVNGKRDWTALDKIVSTAQAHGTKVIPVLTDQWGASTDGPEKYLPWWPAPYGGDGYRTLKWNSTDLVPYRQWVQEAVSHFKDTPTIAFWELINEGEARPASGTHNETTSKNAIRAFADDIGSLVKSLDPNHLVALGTIAGEAGSEESDFSYIHASNAIDIADYHDYDYPYQPLGNTDPYNGLQVSIDRIHALDKPIMVGEMGIHWTTLDSPTLTRRAALFNNKMTAQATAGVAGSLMWCWSEPASTTWDYEIGPTDPSLSMLFTH